MVRSTDAAAIKAKMEKMLAKPPKDFRRSLKDWANKQGVELG